MSIQSAKSKPKSPLPNEAFAIGQQARDLIEKLEKMSVDGNEEAKDQLGWLHEYCLDEIQKTIERKAKAGEKTTRLQPIGTLLAITDFAIPLLLWLSEHQSENIKDYARNRWQWPSLIHLCKREQTKYEKLFSKIELGRNIDLNINPSRTNGDYIFTIAAHAVFAVKNFEPEVRKFSSGSEELIHWNLRWMRGHHKRFQKMESKKFQSAAENFLRSLGKFSRKNFDNWKPVLKTFLTMRHGPFRERLRLLNIKLDDESIQEMQKGSAYHWLGKYRSKHPMDDKEFAETAKLIDEIKWYYFRDPQLLENDSEAVQKIAGRCKTPSGQWTELKDEILKRIHKLAHVS